MQLAGRPCEVCAATVKTANDARGCVDCDLVFHRTCIARSNTCPSCGVGFRESRQRRERATLAESALVARRGTAGEQKFAYAMIALSVVVFVVLLFVGKPIERSIEPILLLLGTVISLYFVVCSMRFRTFVLYEMKVTRAIRWYGPALAHGAYLLLGLGLLVSMGLLAVGRAPF